MNGILESKKENKMNIMKEVIILILFILAFLRAQSSDFIREAEVAGMFYPGRESDLSHMISSYLDKAEKVMNGEIAGLVAPHAGYIYSGPVAAWSYKQIEGKNYDLVVVIAPSHFEYFKGVSVYSGKYYETPLGRIPVDQDMGNMMSEKSKMIQLSGRGHDPGLAGRAEHSLEVQLPFLQTVLGEFKLLPIVIAEQTLQNVEILGNSLAEILKNKRVLIVASSDLSHFHPYETAYQLDQSLLDFFTDFEYRKILAKCESRELEACGYGPIAAMMYACSKLGFKKSKVLNYATSGDVPQGEKSQVVGYLSGVVYK
jgi:AmmeMemoRadiSam system protein B